MKFRFLSGLTFTAILFGIFIPAAGAVQSPLATSPATEQVSTDTNQTVTALADASDTFFDDSTIHEIYLTFDADYYGADGWYDTLYDSHANDPDDPYFPASFSADGVTIDMVGVRFKGNSSFSSSGIKKSFKIDFDEYDEDNDELVFYDLKKLNLNNGFKDPTMLREKLFLDFANEFVTAPRAVHTKVYVNGEYYGLYTAVEQVDKTFAQNRFGDDEDGNLFKGAASDTADANDDFGSDLTWLGSDPEPYYDYYVLQTNETANDYSQLIAFIDVLNNTPADDFPTNLEPLFDVADGLQGLALNNLFVNLDSYNGSAHNYYLYDRDDTGQITHIPWDTNESFGRFTLFMASGEDPLELDPFWLPSPISPGENEERPLMENLWANDDYNNDYLCALEEMLDSGFDTTTMTARIDELADLIRADLYADPNKLYSSSQFETNLYNNISDGRDTIYGLSYFVQQRAAYLQTELASYSLDCTSDMVDLTGTLFVNEFMADNDTILEDPDEAGSYPDWIELYNPGSETIDLGRLYLTDDLTDPTQFQIPDGVTIAGGGFLLFYADDNTDQGDQHTNFKLSAAGESVGLFGADGVTQIDAVTFTAQTTDVAYGRYPDGTGSWAVMCAATPGSSNVGACSYIYLPLVVNH